MTASQEPLRFTIQITNCIPALDYPEISRRLKECYPSYDQQVVLRELFLPIIEEGGYFKKTNFQSFSFSFDLVEDSKIAHEISIAISRYGTRRLIATKTFHASELLPEIEKDFQAFAIRNIAHILKVICNKYKLDSTPLNQLLPGTEGLESIQVGTQSVEILEQHTDELRIHIKLSDSGSGTFSEHMQNGDLMDEVDELLQDANLGQVDGADIGMGYRTIYCVGPNGRTMYELLSKRLESLPANSYVEIASQGKTDRFYPVQ